MKTKPEFLIVGSGGGGGTIAWVLARAGYDVTVLEQGPDFAANHRDPKKPFDPSIHNEAFYRLGKPDPKRRLRGDYNTFMERGSGTPAKPFNGGWTGSVLGGGSVLWGTWSFRALPIDFKLRTLFEKTGQLAGLEADGYSIADWPIEYAEMLPYFTVAEALLGVSGDRSAVNKSIAESDWYKDFAQRFTGDAFFGTPNQWFPDTPYPLGPYPMTPVGRLVFDGFESNSVQKMSAFPTPVAIVQPGSSGLSTRDAIAAALASQAGALKGGIWAQRADQLWSDQIRQACNMCGFCGEFLCWGRTGPKWGTQDTVFKELRQTKNVDIRCNAKVVEVLYDKDTKVAAGVAYLDLTDPDHPRRVEQSAEYVILSCGAVQTARLLFLSGPPEGLGNSTDQLGRNATFHLFGMTAKALLAEKFQGLLHGEFGPTGNVSTFWGYFLKHPASQKWIKAGHFTSAAKKNPLEDAVGAVNGSTPLIGDALLDRVIENNRRFEIRLTGDDLPVPDNRVTLDPKYVDEYGVPVARISRKLGPNEVRLFEAAQPALKSVFTDYVDKGVMAGPKIEDAIVSLVGDHQMGTCRMGDDPEKSVVNRYCRLHDARNVFVVDSSFMPTGLGLNPMVTVVANALRVGSWMVQTKKAGRELWK